MSKLAEKTLEDILLYLRNIVIFEKFALKNGFLQELNVVAKLILTLILITLTLISQNIYVILIFYLISITLACISKVSLKEHLIRTWIFIPIFTAIIAIPAIFNVITPGTPLYTINLGFIKLVVTYEGVAYATKFTLRVATIISFIILLLLTTKWDDLLVALEKIRVPEILITIVNMTYRYIILLIEVTYNMLMSRRSRIIGRESLRESWKWGSEALGALFLKSYYLGNLIYLSMISRGFSGRIISGNKRINLKIRDIITVALITIVCIIIIVIEKCVL